MIFNPMQTLQEYTTKAGVSGSIFLTTEDFNKIVSYRTTDRRYATISDSPAGIRRFLYQNGPAVFEVYIDDATLKPGEFIVRTYAGDTFGEFERWPVELRYMIGDSEEIVKTPTPEDVKRLINFLNNMLEKVYA